MQNIRRIISRPLLDGINMPSEDDKWLKEFLERLSSQIESYSGENMIRESE